MLLVKGLAAFFYRFDTQCNLPIEQMDWSKVRLIILLNHTSLFEPLFIRLAPNRFIWLMARYLVAPGADITLERPMAGRFYRYLLPGIVSITRKKDFSWAVFLSKIQPQSIVAILPEGRMKRASGLDKDGNVMSVRGGVADILQGLNQGSILFIYSGGLHHIQAPGQRWPKLFKTIRVNLEMLDLMEYKQNIQDSGPGDFKPKLMQDLNRRLQNKLP